MMEKGDDGGVQPVNGGVTVDMSENGITHVKDLAFYENKLWEILLRLLAFIFTFIATIIMSVAKENTTVQIQISTSLDTIPLVIRAKSIYTSAFVYFIVVNAIVCGYSGLSLLLVIANKARGKLIHMVLPIAVSDLVMVGLLYSATGAAVAIGLVGKNGNPHVGWNKICGVFGRFCNLITASNVLSFFAAFFYFAVAVLCVFNLHKRSRRSPL
ncbi:CASP-like protein 6 [Zostera marina]|uniref:CASP-like protein n=1 Tax=Zostera marina TaxID=29655 RepID=A0A0K9PH26_ZOSMR|nr:CASP-like protein 6 [Zostera marina]